LKKGHRVNRTIWRWVAILCLVATAGVAVQAVIAPPTVVFIVRHAEKSTTPTNDPHLTPAGQRRAEDLAQVLVAAGVSKIFTTEFQRTQETSRPVARGAGVAPVVIKAADTKQLVSAVVARKSAVVLIVGHSNTIPEIVEGLGGGRVPPIGEAEFDNLYVVVIPRWSKVTLMRLKYGTPGI
jgi:broad specificity phosphatase PhoE